jgi:transposase-like protein
MNLFAINQRFPTERDALEHLEKIRWHGKITCPYCGTDRVTVMTKQLRYHCNVENRSFSVRARTIFEETRLDIRIWFAAIALMLNAKKGISALQVSRDLGITYKTAWYCLMRIRCALADQGHFLRGLVETDTFKLGGKPRKDNKLKTEWMRTKVGSKLGNKTNIFVAVERGKHGKVVAQMIPNQTSETLMKVLKDNVSQQTSVLMTDDAKAYKALDKEFQRVFVTHEKEFSKKGVSINKVEGFFSLMQRGLIGQYHKLSAKYLPFYLSEFTWRYNHNLDKKSFDRALELAVEKNKCMLRYKCNVKKSVKICEI